ncbi:hypothetical protein FS837_011101 [Tulasnella sp. UAMH 9824]|nr:hypothetical protein FS837_011101 [Tulasnella sp. UAMH 9824]
MPPKKNIDTSWWSTRNGSFQHNPEPETREKGKGNAAGAEMDAAEPPVVPGLADLVEFLNTLGATPLGVRPQLNPEQVERLKKSPLRPALQALQPIYRKIVEAQVPQQPETNAPTPQPAPSRWPGPWSSAKQPTPAAAPAAAGITKTEAGLNSVSSKLNSVSQAVTDMKNSTKTAKDQVEAARDQVEAVEKRVSQISGQLDPALAELTQEIKRLQVDLMDDFKAERTRLETKVKELEEEVDQLNKDVGQLENEYFQLGKEADQLQRVIHDSRAELLAVEVASKMALQGTFSYAPDKKGSRKGTHDASGDLVETAKKVRTNTLGLITKCRVLFALVNPDLETDANAPDISMEGEWGRCAEHLRTSNSKLRNAAAEKEEIFQDIQFVGLVLDQIRRGNRVQLVSQSPPRPTGQPDGASNNPPSSAATATFEPSTTEAVISISQGRTTLSDLNACGYLS